MTIYLLNTAIMPQDGHYTRKTISRPEFVGHLQAATQIESYIGYENTANHIHDISGVIVGIRKAETKLPNQATILVCRLNFVSSKKIRQDRLTENDFEYQLITYKR